MWSDGFLHTRVVALAEAAEETSGRSSVDDPAILLFPEIGPGGASALLMVVSK